MIKMAMVGASKSNGSEVTLGTIQSTPTIAPTIFLENTSLQITIHKLNGKYYLQLSRFVQIVIRGKGKIGYLDKSIIKPSNDNPLFLNWDAQNSMVMTCFIHSMEEKIDTYLFFPTTKGI